MTKEKIKDQLWKIHLMSVKLMDSISDDKADDRELYEVWRKLNAIRIDSAESYTMMWYKINKIK